VLWRDVVPDFFIFAYKIKYQNYEIT